MAERLLRILQISTVDIAGGAEKVAWNLFQAYRALGHGSWLAVGRKRSHDPEVFPIPNHENPGGWSRFWWGIHSHLQSLDGRLRGIWRLIHLVRVLAEPGRSFDRYRGVEDFHFPGTWRLLRLTRQPPDPPDIVHCHNLHGGYFDLGVLPWLSHQVPVVLTLHDAWLLGGHCAHSFDCERWKNRCGQCPNLTIYPAIKRDATTYNWKRKRDIYAKSRLYVATPSRWLIKKVEQSILAPAIVEGRVIPNGVDLSVFKPGDKETARAALGLPQDAPVLLFVGHGTRGNPWKDYPTMKDALTWIVACNEKSKLLLICLGEERPEERFGTARILFVGYRKDPVKVAQFYQAADIYLHAAKAETFPNTVLEALACGAPVVATAVGGIREQVKGLGISDFGLRSSVLNRYEMDKATGVLVPPGDAKGMGESIMSLLTDEVLRKRLGENASKDARKRFDLNRQVDDYLEWYEEIFEQWHRANTRNSQMLNVKRKKKDRTIPEDNLLK